jgi:galactokinase
MNLLSLDPMPTLLSRVRAELGADFAGKAIRIARAPGRLDVMGGIADYTGSMVCEATLDRAAAVALCAREDRDVQVFSFNLFDEHQPFTLRVPMEALGTQDTLTLQKEFSRPGRKFAGYIAGCLHVMHKRGLVDLHDAKIRGVNIALYSTVPLGAGVSSSAAIEVATMMALLDHLGIRGKTDKLAVSAMCQEVENKVCGAPCGIMDQVSSCCGEEGSLLRMICQPHELLEPLRLPAGVRAVGINSNVKHSVGGDPEGTPGQYGVTRCAAFMGHAIILHTMKEMGRAAGRDLIGDPMNGYLANLDPDDYKNILRPKIAEWMTGAEFIASYGKTIDAATTVDPAKNYPVQHAVDHHVLEARRVKNFVKYLEQANGTQGRERKGMLDRAGHLMYASHLSYTVDAMLGADECDLLVKLVRERERQGLYGAKITGGGSGGTVAVLCDISASADAAIQEIMREYQAQTGLKPEAFMGSSAGAWAAGTMVI